MAKPRDDDEIYGDVPIQTNIDNVVNRGTITSKSNDSGHKDTDSLSDMKNENQLEVGTSIQNVNPMALNIIDQSEHEEPIKMKSEYTPKEKDREDKPLKSARKYKKVKNNLDIMLKNTQKAYLEDQPKKK